MRSSSKDWLGGILAFLVCLAIAGVLWWFFIAFWSDGDDRAYKWFFQVFLERGFFPGGINPFQFTWLFWLCAAIVAAIGSSVSSPGYSGGSTVVSGAFAGIAAVSVFVCLLVFYVNINDHSGSYAGSTTFVVESTEKTPPSLKRLVSDATPDKNGCALYAHNDMPGCINQGAFDFQWDARVASATGARTVLSRSSVGVSNTMVLRDSLTYLYEKGGEGTWTVIRDGKNRQSIYGIASWAGKGNVEVCTFDGQYSMNKAFSGRWGRNLADEIADRYPTLFYDSDDRYGYCDGKKPVIIIPVKQQIAYRHRTTFRSSGVLTITGSPSGEAQYKHITNVKPGTFPGPVYPASLAKEQRESMGMIAGILDSITGNFGYEPTSVATQSGNPSEYQLRDKKTGRIFWVTPMKPRNSDDQVLAAYAVTPADEAADGSLNKQRIFVLSEGDIRAVNLDDLEARARTALSRFDTGFYQAKGELAEFLPLGDGRWQVYAELGGRVVYRIAISSDSRVAPEVFDLTTSGTTEEAGTEVGAKPEGKKSTKTSACIEDLSKLSKPSLAQCLTDIADEFKKRERS